MNGLEERHDRVDERGGPGIARTAAPEKAPIHGHLPIAMGSETNPFHRPADPVTRESPAVALSQHRQVGRHDLERERERAVAAGARTMKLQQ